MSDAIVVALVGVAGSIIVASVTSYFTTQRTLTQIQVKVDLLWKTYIVDAVAASREAGMVAHHSPEAPTEEWINVIPRQLRDNIDYNIACAAAYFKDPYDIALEVIRVMRDELLPFTINNGLRMKTITGTIFILAHNYLQSQENPC